MSTGQRGTLRLLAGPPAEVGPESWRDHLDRLGPLATARRGTELIETLEATGLLGRGGAGFPVGRKWRTVAERAAGHAVVVVNGAEGEPWSAKDRVLMSLRPHLVVDGALLAAEAVGADRIVFYVGEEHAAARASIARAVAERPVELAGRVRLVAAPTGYVSGEASAAVNCINTGDARPTASPPRPSEAGVDGRPTLVQNVESLACAALIARFGAPWYATRGRGETRGTALVTISGADGPPQVAEVELGTTIGELATRAGAQSGVRAVLTGGYFGSWLDGAAAWQLPLDPLVMRDAGLAFGCGLVSLLPAGECGLALTARIVEFLARSSAGQCGPCVFGLRAIADATTRLAASSAGEEDVTQIARWAGLVRGRGACHHPDGAAELIASALAVFDDDVVAHLRTGRCETETRRQVVA